MTMTTNDKLDMAVEACRRQCAKDHHVEESACVVVSVDANDRYDPNYRPLKDYAPDRDIDFKGWYAAYKAHNYEGNATHVVHMSYVHCETVDSLTGRRSEFSGRTCQAVYGINVSKELCELWCD